METEKINMIKQYLSENEDITLEKILAEINEKSTPVIEENETGYTITFFYQEADLDNISVVGSFPGFDLINQKLRNLAESDIWYRSFNVDNPVNFTYGFVKNFDEDNHELDVMTNIIKDPLNDQDITIYQGEDQVLDLSTLDLVYDKEIEKFFNNTQNQELSIKEKSIASKLYEEQRKYWTLENADNNKYEGIFLCTDGYTFAHDSELLKVFNRLREEQLIPNLLFVFVKNEDRGIELAANEQFKNFLNEELLTEIQTNHDIKFKDNENIICGKSLGGLNAFYTAFDSDIFNNIISHSGTFVWGYPDERERDFLFDAIEEYDFNAHNIYLDVGELEDEFVPMWFMSLIDVNKRMKNLIEEKTDRLFFNIFKGGHDYYCWRKNTVKALLKFFD